MKGVLMSEFASVTAHDPDLPRVAVDIVPLDEDAVDACAEIAATREGDAPARWQEVFAAAMGDPQQIVLVAQVDSVVVGYGKAAHLPLRERGGRGVPNGWYLTGVVVRPEWRRRGIGEQLTRARINALAGQAESLHYFAAAVNAPTIALHAKLGFIEVGRDIDVPSVTFTGGAGVLFRRDLSAE